MIKDINLYMPLVEEVNEVFGQLENLTNDDYATRPGNSNPALPSTWRHIDKDIDDIHKEANEQENSWKGRTLPGDG